MNYTRSSLGNYVVSRLPGEYILSPSDFQWLSHIQSNMEKGKYTSRKIVNAVSKSLPKGKDEYLKKSETFEALCDPWELFIDSGVCDTKCQPINTQY